MTQEVNKPRFHVLGAPTMIELYQMMNAHVPPLAQLKYFGPNGGDYTGFPDEEKLVAAKFIAVFDMLPVTIADIGEITIMDGLDVDLEEYPLALTA